MDRRAEGGYLVADFSLPMTSTYAAERAEREPFAATAVLVASLLAATGVIHLVMVPSHMVEWATEGIGFAVAGWLQIGLAAMVALRPRRWVLFAAVALNVGLSALWVVSRTTGFPFGPHADHAESVTLIDGVTVAMQAVAILSAMAAVTFPSVAAGGIMKRGLSALLPLAVVGITTAVLVSPSARSHSADAHGDHGSVATSGSTNGGSTNGGSTNGAATPAALAAVQGEPVLAADGHLHEADVAAPAAPVQATAQLAASTEVAPAPAAPTVDPAATEGQTHDHGAPAAAPTGAVADDKGLSQVMNGMQHEEVIEPMDGATTAMLAHQLARTAELVAMYPTVADAEAAGYRRQGPFAPGLGVHYGKGGETLVGASITEENVLKPMLIYDGSNPDSKLAGFMYIAFGVEGVPEGFAGKNDSWHSHSNVCLVVRPDGSTDAPLGADRSDVSKDLCDKYGGFLIDNTGYMLHVWTVPGYESSLGVFHEASSALPCPDGTFYSRSDDEIGDSLTTCRE